MKFIPEDIVPYAPFSESLEFEYYVSQFGHLQCRGVNGKKRYEIHFDGRPPEGGLALGELVRVERDGSRILDIGTGSGVIPIGVKSRRDCSITAVDISLRACHLALENFHRNRVDAITNVIQCDLASAFKEKIFDVIVSNPPQLPTMVPASDLRNVAGPTGYEIIDKIIVQSKERLVNGGSLWLYAIGLLGVEERTGALPSLFERLKRVGYEPHVVRKFSRQLSRSSQIHLAFPLIRNIYDKSDVANEYGNMSAYEAYVVNAVLPKN